MIIGGNLGMIASGGPAALYDAIVAAGLSTNLKLCLDAGDASSYSGSGQKWLDRSGGGYDFFRGVNVTVTTDDPTFNGTSGGLTSSEYFSYDGADCFQYDTALETWMNNLHKEAAKFTILGVGYSPASAGGQQFVSTSEYSGGASGGIEFIWNGSTLELIVMRGGTNLAVNPYVSSTRPVGGWFGIALSIDENAGASGGIFWRDGATLSTFNPAYTTPTTSAADFPLRIGSFRGTPTVPTYFTSSGDRLACLAIWEGGALTATDLNNIWTTQNIKGRFGL